MLSITHDLVRELYERSQRLEAAIILGPDGWGCDVWTDGAPDSPLIALDRGHIETWEDPDADGLSTADIEAMMEGHDYRIRDEDGGYTVPGDETDWAVVTGDEDEPWWSDLPWDEAWWFDLGRARCVVDEGEGTGSVWVTAGGIWLLCAVNGQWARLSAQNASVMIYDADAGLMREDAPLLARAARAARELADLMSYDIPQGDGRLSADTLAWRQCHTAVDHVHTAHAIGELVRRRVQPAIRDGRQGAAYTVRMAHDGNTTAAAAELGMGRSTFLGLIQSVPQAGDRSAEE